MLVALECPFAPGDEVAVLDGPGGKAVEIRTVKAVFPMTYQQKLHRNSGCSGFAVELEGHLQSFFPTDMGYCRRTRTATRFIVPATHEHRLALRHSSLLIAIKTYKHWHLLPESALERVIEAISQYHPGGVQG